MHIKQITSTSLIKNKLWSLSVIPLLILSVSANAENVNMTLEIEGEGTISSEDGSIECSANCEFVVDSTQELILKPTPKEDFNGWSSESCDFGEDALISQVPVTIESVRNGAKTISSADFDNDGDIDVVTIDLFSGTIQRLLNDGNGSFGSTILVDSMAYPSAVTTVDWDDDNDSDVIAVAYNENAVYWYSNNGDGTFGDRQIINLPVSSVYSIDSADVDQDGDLDLLVGSFSANTSGDLSVLENSISNAEIAWYLNDGEFQFTDSIHVASDLGAITLSAGDLDSDGDIDVVAALIAQDKSVYFENNDAAFGQLQTIISTNGAYGVATGDVDNDGDLDVLTAGYWANSLILSINDGSGQFSNSHAVGKPDAGISATDLNDLNGDGLVDILAGVFNHDIFFWYENLSVIDCKLTPQTDRLLKVSFTEADLPQDNETPPDGSGGGAFRIEIAGLFLLLILFNLFFKRASK